MRSASALTSTSVPFWSQTTRPSGAASISARNGTFQSSPMRRLDRHRVYARENAIKGEVRGHHGTTLAPFGLVLLRYFSEMGSPSRSCLAAWQIGQRGSQRAMAQAKARRIVTRESWKWRSGRDADRIVGFLSESGARGGKMPFSPPSEQGEASERAGDMV